VNFTEKLYIPEEKKDPESFQREGVGKELYKTSKIQMQRISQFWKVGNSGVTFSMASHLDF
jgi:hypothetical protein